MLVEQLLREWIGERQSAAELAVAARSAKVIAHEIETHFAQAVARAEAAVSEMSQRLADRERALQQAVELGAKLEAQLVQVKSRSDRIVESKDSVIESSLSTIAELGKEFSRTQQGLELRVAELEGRIAQRETELREQSVTVRHLEAELGMAQHQLMRYRERFGTIADAVV